MFNSATKVKQSLFFAIGLLILLIQPKRKLVLFTKSLNFPNLDFDEIFLEDFGRQCFYFGEHRIEKNFYALIHKDIDERSRIFVLGTVEFDLDVVTTFQGLNAIGLVGNYSEYPSTFIFNKQTKEFLFRNANSVILKANQQILRQTRPIVSVIIPFYDSYKWFEETLKSLDEQTFTQFEIIIVDDHSKKPLHVDRDIRIIRHTSNQGLSISRNTGALVAKGKYILFLDPDDLISKNCIEKLVLAAMMTGDKFSFVYSQVVHFQDINHVSRFEFNVEEMLNENQLPSFALIPRELYLAIGGMCDAYWEDYDYWIRNIALGYRGLLVDEPLFFYRRHSFGQSTQLKKIRKEVWFKQLQDYNPTLFGSDPPNIRCYRSLNPNYNLYPLTLSYYSTDNNKYLHTNAWSYRRPKFDNKIEFEKVKGTEGKTSILCFLPYLMTGGADYYDFDLMYVLKEKFHVTILCEKRIQSNLTIRAEADFEVFYYSHDDSHFDLVEYLIKSRSVKVLYNRNTLIGYESIRKNPNLRAIDALHVSPAFSEWPNISNEYLPFINQRIYASNSLRREITNSVNSVVIPPSIDDSNLQDPLSSQETTTIIFVGRLEEQKNPQLFLKIAHEIHSMHNVKVLIIGNGSLINEVETNANGLDVKLIRDIDRLEVQKYMKYGLVGLERGSASRSSPTVLISTSEYEGIPTVIIEALCLGVPVIAVNSSQSISELFNEARSFSDRKIAHLIEKGHDTVNEAVQIFNRLKLGPPLRNKQFCEKYSLKRFKKQVSSLFDLEM